MLEFIGQLVVNKIDLIDKKSISTPSLFDDSVADKELISISEPLDFNLLPEDLTSISQPGIFAV